MMKTQVIKKKEEKGKRIWKTKAVRNYNKLNPSFISFPDF